jgi:lysophospholipase L1-like esterase
MSETGNVEKGRTIVESAIYTRPYGSSLADLPARLVLPHLEKWRRVVCIGDSVNEGMWDGVDPTVDWRLYENQQNAPTTQFFGWADRLAGHLSRRRVDAGLSPVLYANLAVRGKLIHFIVDNEVPQALELHPDLVIMDGGGNDILRPGTSISRVLRSIEHGIRQIRATGADVLYLLAAQPSERMDFVRKKTADYDTRIKSLADKLDFYVVDSWAFEPMRDPRLWSRDMIHPSSEGHERIAQMALLGLGLRPDPAWDDGALTRPLPDVLVTHSEKIAVSNQWLHDYAVPWVGRRLKGTSSGDGRSGKRPDLIEMPPSAPHPGSALLAGRPAAPHPFGPSAKGWLSDEEIRALHSSPSQLAALRRSVLRAHPAMGSFGEALAQDGSIRPAVPEKPADSEAADGDGHDIDGIKGSDPTDASDGNAADHCDDNRDNPDNNSDNEEQA